MPAHGVTRARLEEVVQTFFTFLDLPEELKTPICRTMPGEDRIEIGYMRRRATDDTDAEEKMYFHYHPDVETLFASAIHAAGEKTKDFLRAARAVWDTTIQISEDAVDEFETKWPGVKPRFFPLNAAPHLVIRFLAYHARGAGNFLAKAHYDRGTFTIALGESAPGLRIGTPEKLVPVEHHDNEVVIMPGTGFQADIDSGVVPAWHDVVQTKGAEITTNTARWAVVAFFDVADATYVPLSDTHLPR